jgi:hypothetical protein
VVAVGPNDRHVLVVGHDVGQVLVKRSPASNVEHLDASADRQYRDALGHSSVKERYLKFVAGPVGPLRLWVPVGTEQGGVDVGASCQHQPVDPFDQRIGDPDHRGQDDRDAPSVRRRMDVIGRDQRDLFFPDAVTRDELAGGNADCRPLVRSG